jgi:hypothetical protein
VLRQSAHETVSKNRDQARAALQRMRERAERRKARSLRLDEWKA